VVAPKVAAGCPVQTPWALRQVEQVLVALVLAGLVLVVLLWPPQLVLGQEVLTRQAPARAW